ncbi:MAG: hypothetical protein V3U75_08715 [Methylococcaceae bacterium]
MDNRFKYLFIYFFIAVFVLSQAVAEPSLTQVGVIDYFEGNPEQYSLHRDGTPVPIGLYTMVFAGDIIVAHDDSIAMRLIVDGKPVTLTRQNSPLVLTQTANVPTVLGNLYTWAGEFFTPLYDKTRKDQLVGAVGRGGNPNRISSELLVFEPLVLMPGTRGIYLAWEGGKPPYRVAIASGTRMIVETQVPALSTVRIKSLSLSSGEYSITITDKNNLNYSTSLTVQSADIAAPASIEKGRLPEEVKATLLAGWLAGQKEGYWRFEAYQRVAPYADGYSNARLLKYALENGIPVPYFAAK